MWASEGSSWQPFKMRGGALVSQDNTACGSLGEAPILVCHYYGAIHGPDSEGAWCVYMV